MITYNEAAVMRTRLLHKNPAKNREMPRAQEFIISHPATPDFIIARKKYVELTADSNVNTAMIQPIFALLKEDFPFILFSPNA